jgi:uncharacterized protein
MYINISNLSDGVHNFNFDEAVTQINLEEPFFGNFLVDIELSKSVNQIILSADFSVKAHFECDRCSNDYRTDLKGSFKIVYFLGNKPDDVEKDNLIYLPITSDRIEIGKDLRDFALLSVPMKKICREDCKGLCFNCGKDLNEGDCNCDKSRLDVRWLPLMELKNKLNNN